MGGVAVAYHSAVTQYLDIHPDNPQARLVRLAVDSVRSGGVIAYPTDSCYALGCRVGDKEALERVRAIRQADKNHHFTLVCRDLSEIARYARVDTWQFRLLKACTPGPYTFLQWLDPVTGIYRVRPTSATGTQLVNSDDPKPL